MDDHLKKNIKKSANFRSDLTVFSNVLIKYFPVALFILIATRLQYNILLAIITEERIDRIFAKKRRSSGEAESTQNGGKFYHFKRGLFMDYVHI